MNEQRAEEIVTAITGQRHTVTGIKKAHGGCISDSYIIITLDDSLFLKESGLNQKDMFDAEATGLKELSLCNSLKIPKVLGTLESNTSCYILLESLNLKPHSPSSLKNLGQSLADMHRITSEKFGFPDSNYIGSTPQINHKCTSWVDFYNNCRLMPQAYMTGNDAIENKAEELSEKAAAFFTDYSPVPSLLHGDLWSGNTARIENDTPVIYDPAVYYGDRESDLAFTEFFGGFSKDFYDSYQQSWEVHPSYEIRRYLYQLYHSLNHLNLFGNSYLNRSMEMLDYLLKVKY